MKTYNVTATRSNGWWAIHADVPNAAVNSQSRTRPEIEPMIREAIALVLDIPQDSFDIALTVTELSA